MKKREVRLSPAMQRAIRRLSKRFPHIMDDLKPLLNNLETGENPGDALSGFSRRVYKVRVPSSDQRRGKRGGFRVVYYLVSEDHRVYLLTMYAKSRQENIRTEKINSLIQQLNL
ncbi:type II toxin-antitoxin system RelE/ParE family toxin [Candidatus Thiosymbion oneisti]|uniref:type II toxin-antitoxin system RelE/ParE family toxin n=1 Tax=Candidatus Thiosymbion oneisti TaxID=589554 RepID=UPI00114D3986|nr:addiction module antitoxin [Candidatus Thiosymbion oneisti]